MNQPSSALQNLYTTYLTACHEVETASKTFSAQDKTYEDALAAWQNDHLSLVRDWQSSKNVLDSLRKTKEAAKAKLKQALLNLHDESPETDLTDLFAGSVVNTRNHTEFTVLPGMEQHLRQELLAHFVWLITVDMELLNTFLSGIAIKDAEGNPTLPPSIAPYLTSVQGIRRVEVTLSDKEAALTHATEAENKDRME